ncbi:uncharacterized protein K444DRAFT_711506 [Hyaloscypha bicolor E]|uniref:Uncharacterized protein n=1 Tax=Hyaloscypha bicolor E TaxID=1095630 RepID=A0A2J6SFY5_9HELO|nr:uncharacterized protein K444DRAFT_711506 [Hyaloscypha bicolor E]PMD49664.1 hypothetical protein K444DRAFT_711506 [Hyaloscypha bicolor E]
MLHSMACLVSDIETIDVAIILSSTNEVNELRKLLDDSSVTKNSTHLRNPPRITLHNLYDIAPPSIQNITNPEDTTDLLRFKKYKYYEGFVLRPVAFKEMVQQWASGPVIWYETWPVDSPLRSDWIVAINEACAHTLGRTMENFGVSMTFWEGYTWILEKEIVMDMVNSPSRLEPGVEFWIRLLNAPSDIFESCLFKIHIAGRKQEQSSSTSALYTKYKVQNMKDALLDFGLEAAYNRLPAKADVIYEWFFYMLQEERLQDLLIEFLRQHKDFFVHFKPEFIDLVDRNILESFLRKAPLAMTVCGANTLPVDVIPSAQLKGAWNMTYM